jgi:CubicO group peptidase (beta-lactamase class C family)
MRNFKAWTIALVTLLAACSAGENPSASTIATRDDLVIVAKPGGAVRVDVLENDSTTDGSALELVSAMASDGSVSIDRGWLVVAPEPGFRGVIEVSYRVRSASGDQSTPRPAQRLEAHDDGKLTVYVDSYFDDLLARLERGDAGKRMIDGFDLDGQAPYDPQMLLMLKHKGRLVLKRRWGTEFDEDTPQPMASASKFISAALVLAAKDKGVIDLDAPVSRYLPSFRNPQLDGAGPQRGDFTMRQGHAMTHGLFSNHRYHTMRSLSLDQSVEKIRASAVTPGNGLTSGPVLMEYEPGTQVGYDGKGMQVVGSAVLQAYGDGRTWLEHAKQTVFDPCGMKDSRWDHFYPANPAVAGGLVTTANDYLRFIEMLQKEGLCGDRRVLAKSSVDAFFQYHQSPEGGVHPRRTPIYYSPWMNCGAEPHGRGAKPVDCTTWPDGTPTDSGTFFENGNDNLRYAYGAWVAAEHDGSINTLLSPGAFGTAPFIDRRRQVSGIIFTKLAVSGNPDGLEVGLHQVATLFSIRFSRERLDDALTRDDADLAPAEDI